MKHIPNMLTFARILLSPLLLITEPFTAPFYALYGLCGLTDFLDGKLARRLHAASRTGASLDNIADYTLMGCTLVKVLPALRLTLWVLCWALVMLAAHLASSVIAFVKYRKIVVLHTIANKAVGAACYSVPILAGFVGHSLLIGAVCALACFSVGEELYLIITSTRLEPDVRGVLLSNDGIHRGYADAGAAREEDSSI